jgi:hypothetical protein
VHGAKAKNRPLDATAPGTRMDSTPFGLQCVRYNAPASGGARSGSVCWPWLRRQCLATGFMAPIELLTPVSPTDVMTLRTTSLRTGVRGALIDRNSWALP